MDHTQGVGIGLSTADALSQSLGGQVRISQDYSN